MKNQKLSKSVLKEIVKECLVEILAEGLVSDRSTSKTSQTKSLKESLIAASNVERHTPEKKNKPGYLKSINFKDSEELERKSKTINHSLDRIAGSITKDPVLSEMLMDTAHTTLQEQLAADSKRGHVMTGVGDKAQKAVANSNPEDLFGGEVAGKWAALAFNS